LLQSQQQLLCFTDKQLNERNVFLQIAIFAKPYALANEFDSSAVLPQRLQAVNTFPICCSKPVEKTSTDLLIFLIGLASI
jgi:hypothetical protein